MKQSFCIQCGAPLVETAKFCAGCGKRVLDVKDAGSRAKAHSNFPALQTRDTETEPLRDDHPVGTSLSSLSRKDGLSPIKGRVGFVALYLATIAPTYVLPYFGSNSAIINLAGASFGAGFSPQFWWHVTALFFAIVVGWFRGIYIGQPWIAIFPFFASVFDLVPGFNWILMVPTVFHIVCLVLGVRGNVVVARVPTLTFRLAAVSLAALAGWSVFHFVTWKSGVRNPYVSATSTSVSDARSNTSDVAARAQFSAVVIAQGAERVIDAPVGNWSTTIAIPVCPDELFYRSNREVRYWRNVDARPSKGPSSSFCSPGANDPQTVRFQSSGNDVGQVAIGVFQAKDQAEWKAIDDRLAARVAGAK